MDLIDRFPQRSSRGNKYILVGYHYDSNVIYDILIQNRKGATITEGWKTLQDIFEKIGAAHSTWILNNETSQNLMDSFREAETYFQLVSPYKHKNNLAERAIQIQK